MRIFALQTNIDALKKQFILESEEEILTTRHHSLVFFIPFVLATCAAVPILILLIVVSPFFIHESLTFFIGWEMAVVLFWYAYVIIRSFINWRYNVLIITNKKIVIIKHIFLFYQHVNPVQLDHLVSTTSESQLLGIWHCGTLRITWEGQRGKSSKEIVLRYIPKAEFIAGAINNAMTLLTQKTIIETAQEQAPKLQEVQEKVVEKLPETLPAEQRESGAATVVPEDTL